MFQAILVFYYCITNYHKLSSLKWKFISSQFVHRKSGMFQLAFPSGSHTDEIKVSVVCPHLEVWLGKDLLSISLRLLAEFTSCSSMTQVPVYWLVVGWGPLYLEVTLGSFPCGPIYYIIFLKTRSYLYSFKFLRFVCLWSLGLHLKSKAHPHVRQRAY